MTIQKGTRVRLGCKVGMVRCVRDDGAFVVINGKCQFVPQERLEKAVQNRV